MNFGFNGKYNKKGNKLQGHMNIIFRRLKTDGIYTYQIKGNAMQSLGVNIADENHKTAEFITKSNFTDITDAYYPIPLGGNLILKVNLTDKGEPGSMDKIAVTLMDNNSHVYSSNWNGLSTDEMLLSGGNLVVHSGFSLASTTQKVQSASLETDEFTGLYFTVSPNPTIDYFTVHIKIENKKDQIQLFVHDYNGSLVYKTSGKPDEEYTFGLNFQAGAYVVRVEQAGEVQQKIVIRDN